MHTSNTYNAHKCYVSNNFKGAMFDYKGVLHWEGYQNGKIPVEIKDVPLFEPFFTNRVKLFNRLDSSMLYCEFGVEFSPISDLLYPNVKVKMRLIRARPTSFHD